MSDIKIIKPDPDYKIYRYLQLQNGIRVILISNVKSGETIEPLDCNKDDVNDEIESQGSDGEVPEFDLRKSAAALTVKVGSFSDPEEAQGLAHFLEHMVFMGSEKYPRENDFHDYISHRDGSRNAYTEGDSTTFYFEVQRNYFKEALDRFANFFISPLLRKDCVDRELEAVDSEFELSKANESCRLVHLLSQLSKEDSPFNSFIRGNRISLKEIPDSVGTNIYELLRKFQRDYYNASLMTLAIESKDTLDSLETLVRDIFASVPSRECKAPDFSIHVNPFPSSVFKKLYKIAPIKERTTLQFVWSLPPMRSHYRSAALKFVSTIIAHEGNGSLLAFLQKKNLAMYLHAGCSNNYFFNNDMTALFEITIGLSDLSRSNPIQLVTYVFSFLRMLRDSANFSLANPSDERAPWGDRSFASLIPEFQQIWAANFRFQEPMEPHLDVQSIALALQFYPPEEVFAAGRIMFERDLKTYVEVVNMLKPDSAIMAVLLPEYKGEAAKDVNCKEFLKERWYGIRYAVEDLSEQDFAKWNSVEALPDFHLPEVNPFVITKFDLLPTAEDNALPREVNLGPLQKFGELWHQQRTKYNIPVAHVFVELSSDVIQTPKDAMILALWMHAFNKRLITLLYSATEANYEFTVNAITQGIGISVAGFTEKHFLLYQEVISLLKKPLIADNDEDSLITEVSFSVLKESMRQSASNKLLNPKRLNSHIKKYLHLANVHIAEDSLNALESLTLSDILEFVPRFLSRLYIRMFGFGNLTANDALNYFEYTQSTLLPTEVATMKPYLKANIPSGINRIRVKNFNKTDVNMSLTLMNPLVNTPTSDLRTEVLCDLFACILNEPAFAYLRTTETLGYDVRLERWYMSSFTCQSGISVRVQSQANKFDCNFVAGRLYAFWYRIVPQIIFNLKEESFDTAVEAEIASNMTEETTMDAESDRFKREVFSIIHEFKRRYKYIEILKRLKLIDLQEFYRNTFYDFSKQPSIMIQVEAQTTGENTEEMGDVETSNALLKTYRWPIKIVPMTESQIEAEYESAAAVDVGEALKACASEAVTPGAFKEEDGVNGDGETIPNSEVKKFQLPKITEIVDLREFKNHVLFMS
nr:nardilysin [Hymenolepis microstoma]